MEGKSYARLVTLKVPGVPGGNASTTLTFPMQQDIRYARIQAIEAYFASDMAVAQPETIAVLPDNLASKVSLVLETNDPDDMGHTKGKDGRFSSTTQTTKWLPLPAFHRMQNQNVASGSNSSFVRYLFEYKDLYVSWEKSFVMIAPGGLGNTTDLAIVLGVWYTFIDKEGKAIKRT